jgi:hypothetical protein
VYALDAEGMRDVPGEVAMDDVSFEQWLEAGEPREYTLNRPRALGH